MFFYCCINASKYIIEQKGNWLTLVNGVNTPEQVENRRMIVMFVYVLNRLYVKYTGSLVRYTLRKINGRLHYTIHVF